MRNNKVILSSAVFILLACIYLVGIPDVPFHPDESTHIFMSSDFDVLWDEPLSLAWTPQAPANEILKIRSLGAPLTKYIFGVFRAILHQPPLESDWHWSMSWDANLQNGAYPDQELLLVTRFSATMLTLGALFFLFKAVQQIWGYPTALIALLLMGLNPLVLLHGRRAMNEPAALLGVCLFIWVLTRERINPLWMGVSLAVMINAKQILLILLPMGIIAVTFLSTDRFSRSLFLQKAAFTLLPLLLITAILNPFYWKYPFQAAKFSQQTITELQSQQLDDYYFGKEQNLHQTLKYRTLALLGNLFFAQPSYSDVGNYDQDLSLDIRKYQEVPIHSFGRNLIFGSVLIAFFWGGISLELYKILQRKPNQDRRLLLLAVTAVLFAAILVLLPLPWQRYCLPLTPLVSLWAAAGLHPLSRLVPDLSTLPKSIDAKP